MVRVKHCFFIFAAFGALTTLIRLQILNSVGSTIAVWAKADAPSLDDVANTLPKGKGFDAPSNLVGLSAGLKSTTSIFWAQNPVVLGPEHYRHRTSISTNSPTNTTYQQRDDTTLSPPISTNSPASTTYQQRVGTTLSPPISTNSPTSTTYQQRDGITLSPPNSEKVDIQSTSSTSSMQRQASSAAVADHQPVRVFEVMSRIIDPHDPASAFPSTAALRTSKVQLDWPLPQLVDVVSAAHHSDGAALLNLALPSMFRSIRHLRYVYIVCSSRMCEMLKERLASSAYDFNTSRVFVVPEDRKSVV